jgi:hypothetical protein
MFVSRTIKWKKFIGKRILYRISILKEKNLGKILNKKKTLFFRQLRQTTREFPAFSVGLWKSKYLEWIKISLYGTFEKKFCLKFTDIRWNYSYTKFVCFFYFCFLKSIGIVHRTILISIIERYPFWKVLRHTRNKLNKYFWWRFHRTSNR